MTQQTVYQKYVMLFPQFAEHTKEWFPNGKNSVRVRQENGKDFVFTWNGKKEWKFETVDNFIKGMRSKGGK